MEKAKVYFTDFRCPVGTSALDKLQRLCKAAHMGDIDFQGKFTAIKMHFGELGNLATIRPQYVKAVADLVKEWGGKPFLTDCNTLYPGSRKNALMKWKYRFPEGSTSRRPKSAAPSWMRMYSSAWLISKAMKPLGSAER